jgi:hypothetical protein
MVPVTIQYTSWPCDSIIAMPTPLPILSLQAVRVPPAHHHHHVAHHQPPMWQDLGSAGGDKPQSWQAWPLPTSACDVGQRPFHAAPVTMHCRRTYVLAPLLPAGSAYPAHTRPVHAWASHAFHPRGHRTLYMGLCRYSDKTVPNIWAGMHWYWTSHIHYGLCGMLPGVPSLWVKSAEEGWAGKG